MSTPAIRNKKIARLIERARERGWDVWLDGRGHVRARSQTGEFWVSTTANDKAMGHHYENAKASARRAGLDTKGL